MTQAPMQQTPELSPMAVRDPAILERAFGRAAERSQQLGQQYFDALIESHSGFWHLSSDERWQRYVELDLQYGSSLAWLSQLSHFNPAEALKTAADLRTQIRQRGGA